MMITAERLREVLDYDPESGIFRWKVPGHKTKVGAIAGNPGGGNNPNRKYWRIGVDGHRYYAHRLAWLYTHNEWPEQIDHKDLDRWNNSISNLRIATDAQNQWNRTKDRKNTSGYKGVRKHKNCKECYSARFTIGKVTRHLGCFKTAEEAHQAYLNAAKTYYGEFARG